MCFRYRGVGHSVSTALIFLSKITHYVRISESAKTFNRIPGS